MYWNAPVKSPAVGGGPTILMFQAAIRSTAIIAAGNITKKRAERGSDSRKEKIWVANLSR